MRETLHHPTVVMWALRITTLAILGGVFLGHGWRAGVWASFAVIAAAWEGVASALVWDKRRNEGAQQ